MRITYVLVLRNSLVNSIARIPYYFPLILLADIRGDDAC